MKKPKRISLTNLDRATAQEVFNWGAYHLLTQGKKSLIGIDGKENSCAYRGRDGTACAAGGFLTDRQYRQSFENRMWTTLVRDGKVPYNHSSLIYSLQWVHDNNDPCRWKCELAAVAQRHNLNADILKEFP